MGCSGLRIGRHLQSLGGPHCLAQRRIAIRVLMKGLNRSILRVPTTRIPPTLGIQGVAADQASKLRFVILSADVSPASRPAGSLRAVKSSGLYFSLSSSL